METQSVNGRWRAPGFEPAEGIAGVLTIDPAGRCELNLLGAFSDVHDSGDGRAGGRRRDLPIIYGRTLDGREYTLLDGWIRRSTSTYAGPFEQTVGAVRALKGIHLSTSDEAVFSSARIELENLAVWAGSAGFTIKVDSERTKQTVELAKPDPIEFEYDGLRFRIRTNVGLFNHSLTRTSVDVTCPTTAVLVVESETPLPCDGFDAAASSWVDLLTFATAKPCAIRSFTLRHKDDSIQNVPRLIENEDGTASFGTVEASFHRDIEMRVHWSVEPDAEPDRSVNLHDFAFLVGDRPISEWYSAWMLLRAQATDGINSLLSLTYGSNTFVQADLLVVATCAETLHRGLHPDCLAMQPRDFEKMMDAAVAKLNEEDTERVRGAIHNEPSYMQRLLDLLRMLPEKVVAEALIVDPKKWARKVTGTRNGLAHGLRNTESEIDALYNTYRRTRLILELVIMSELGVDEERLQTYAVEHRVFD